MKKIPLFEIALLIFFIAFLIGSFNYTPEARIFPLAIAILGLFLTSVSIIKQTFQEIITKERTKQPEDSEKNQAAEKTKRIKLREWYIGAATLGFLLIAYFLGFLFAIPIYILFTLRFIESKGWGRSLLAAGGLTICLYVLFMHVLGVPIYMGILWH